MGDTANTNVHPGQITVLGDGSVFPASELFSGDFSFVLLALEGVWAPASGDWYEVTKNGNPFTSEGASTGTETRTPINWHGFMVFGPGDTIALVQTVAVPITAVYVTGFFWAPRF